MAGNEVTRDRHVAARPEAVWAVLTDLDNAAETLSGVTRIERLTDGPYAVGTRWRETRRMFGKEATEEFVVTAVDAPRRTVVEADAAGIHYVTEFSLAEEGDGSRLTMRFRGEQGEMSGWQRLAYLVFGRLGMRATAKVMEQDLADIAARAER